MPNIKLRSSDGEIIIVEAQVMACSKIIQSIIQVQSENQIDVINFKNINSVILTKIVEWAYHFKNVQSLPMGVHPDVQAWEENFLNENLVVLFQLLHTANELGIKELTTILLDKMI